MTPSIKNVNGTALLALLRASNQKGETLYHFRTVQARITDERIRTLTRTFDRKTGKRLNRWHPSMGTVTLVAYRVDKEPMTVMDPVLLKKHEAGMGVGDVEA